MRNLIYYGLIATFPVLAACGGGGGSSSTVSVPTGTGTTTPTTTATTWVANQFSPEADFKNQCETPRTGSSPITGEDYQDVAGSTLLEKFWLRSWNNRTYLWYDEVTDIDPGSIADRVSYFDVLKTNRVTASGNPVDQFHFTIPTDEYEQLVSSGASAGYGARFQVIESSPPREIIVAFVEPGSPAAAQGVLRGDKVIEVDGVVVETGTDVTTLNAGLFPDGSGEAHTFVLQSQGSTTTRSVTITSDIVTSDPVPLFKIETRTDGKKIAYLLLNTFGTSTAEEELFNAVTSIAAQNVDELVLDLRYNGGGFLAISSELAYMIAGAAATNSRTFETLVFNDKFPTTNPVTGNTLAPTPFYSTAQGFTVNDGTPLPTLDLDRVFVLSTSSTCSASESLINSLEGIDIDVIMMGTTTCGKPYGFYATDNCGETYFTIQFRGENDKGFGDYADGFSPFNGGTVVGEPITGCSVDDDFTKPLGDVTEDLFEAALSYVDTGTCPATTTTSKTEKVWGDTQTKLGPLSLFSEPRIRARQQLETARIRNHPAMQETNP